MLSEISAEQVVSSDNVTASSDNSTAAAPEYKISRLSRESDLSMSTGTQRPHSVASVRTEKPSVVMETVSAAPSETDAANGRPDLSTSQLHSRPVPFISQYSLPEQPYVSSKEDKDLSATVSLFFFNSKNYCTSSCVCD